jgi:hypothetical protein
MIVYYRLVLPTIFIYFLVKKIIMWLYLCSISYQQKSGLANIYSVSDCWRHFLFDTIDMARFIVAVKKGNTSYKLWPSPRLYQDSSKEKM